MSKRAHIHFIYDCLHAYGIPATPEKDDALSAWADMQPREGLIPRPSDGTVAVVGNVNGTSYEIAAPQKETYAQVVHIENLHDLIEKKQEVQYGSMFNHIWALHTLLNIPMDVIEKHHRDIGEDIFDRINECRPQPHRMTYVMKGFKVPLLLWYHIQKKRVTSLLREYLHICLPSVPELRVWTWHMIPRGVHVDLVARRFAAHNVLPSIKGLYSYIGLAYVHSIDTLEKWAGRLHQDPERRHLQSTYENGVSAIWLGDDVFFGVDDSNVFRLPKYLCDLPRWLLLLLLQDEEEDVLSIQDKVDVYLDHFCALETPALKILRCINWGSLPLHWKPAFLKNIPVFATEEESHSAHEQLIHMVTQSETDKGIITRAIDLVDYICGLC